MAAPTVLFRWATAKPLLNRIWHTANTRWTPVANYAAKKGAIGKVGKLGPVAEKKKLPVVSDPELLVNYVCGSNILKEGDDVKLKPDSEYPDWLWTLRIGSPPSIEEMDPDTLEYWRKLEELYMCRHRKLRKGKKFVPQKYLR